MTSPHSPHFEYNTQRRCIESSEAQRPVHRFGTPEISHCQCGEYLRSQEPNPSWRYIKSSLAANVAAAPTKKRVVFSNFVSGQCDDRRHVVNADEMFCDCKATVPDSFYVCEKYYRPCRLDLCNHYFLVAGGGCECGKYDGREHKPFVEASRATIDRAWLIDFFEKTTTRMVDTMKKKNADYGGAVPDPFSNFVQVETLGIATAEQGFLTRMTDKLCRVASFAKNGELQVKDESVSDTLLDLANYSLLMMAYLESKRVQ